MKFIATLQSYLESKNRAFFYKALGGFIGALVLIMALFFLRYYQQVSALKKKIRTLNELRDEARIVREKAQQVQNQRAAVDAMLAEDFDFKIAGYFSDVLDQMGLSDKKSSEETAQIDRNDNYRESELMAQLVGMNMKELTELLYELEQKSRIYIKRLDIEKSKKSASGIDVSITIATLLPKTE